MKIFQITFSIRGREQVEFIKALSTITALKMLAQSLPSKDRPLLNVIKVNMLKDICSK